MKNNYTTPIILILFIITLLIAGWSLKEYVDTRIDIKIAAKIDAMDSKVILDVIDQLNQTTTITGKNRQAIQSITKYIKEQSAVNGKKRR